MQEALQIIAIWAAVWSAEPQRQIQLTNEIPAELHGCWEMREKADEEFPDGLSSNMTVKADRIIIDAAGLDRQIGKIEEVQRLAPGLFEGMISTNDENGRSTVATTLQLNPEGTRPDTLLRREGDAASYHYRRCSPAAAASQRYSLVIAETATQDDPSPAPCGRDGSCNDFLFRAEFNNAKVVAGAELPTQFDARLTLHSPYISTYTLALIVEQQADGSLTVRRQAGFNGRNGVACFNAANEWPVDWRPEQVAAVRYERGDLCVFDKDQIDLSAPM